MVKAALAVELDGYGKTLADFEADLLKTAKDEKDKKDKKESGSLIARMAFPLSALGFAAGKGVANTVGQSAVLAGQQAARVDEKMDNDDKVVNDIHSRKAVLNKAIQNLKAKHPDLN
jgi:hypothetical protein